MIGRWQGQQDSPLTDEGIQQAKYLGKRLQKCGITIDAVYSSDLLVRFHTRGQPQPFKMHDLDSRLLLIIAGRNDINCGSFACGQD